MCCLLWAWTPCNYILQCRYEVVKTMLKPPLLDSNVSEDKLADWIDTHTMRVHGFLDRLQQVTAIFTGLKTRGRKNTHCSHQLIDASKNLLIYHKGPTVWISRLYS